ncbi:serine/threonine-protein kinase [Streptacidiphilus jiangxiensis]|nr:serine/threonine-protein kinase [Streptacidiphilus jiangxiensis]
MVAGRYRLVAQLGRGGMGTVWRADDLLLGRPVAVKEVHPRGGLLEAEQRNRTLREAQAVARVTHPSVVGVHDVVEQDGRPWIVMELVDGASLAARIAGEGPLPPREAARMGLAVLDALCAAHAIGVLHRDVKPANVLWERAKDRWVLTDFGIARIDGEATLTEAGAFLGSPEFTAPERLHGEEGGPAADLWSLGALLVAALDGRSLFHRTAVTAVLHAVAFGAITLPERARPLAAVIEPLLQRDPASRPQPTWIRAQLETFVRDGALGATVRAAPGQHGPGQHAPGQRGPEQAASPTAASGAGGRRRGRRAAALVGSAVVVVAAALGGSFAVDAWSGGPSGGAAPGTPTGGPSAPIGSTPLAGAGPLPAGFAVQQDSHGFRLAVPTGWDRQVDAGDGTRVYYVSPAQAGAPEALYKIGIRVQPGVSGTPLAAQVCPDPRGYAEFRSTGPHRTVRDGHPAASCSFTWQGTPGGPPRLSELLLWTDAGTTYTLWASGPTTDPARVGLMLDTASDTFTPAGSPTG